MRVNSIKISTPRCIRFLVRFSVATTNEFEPRTSGRHLQRDTRKRNATTAASSVMSRKRGRCKTTWQNVETTTGGFTAGVVYKGRALVVGTATRVACRCAPGPLSRRLRGRVRKGRRPRGPAAVRRRRGFVSFSFVSLFTRRRALQLSVFIVGGAFKGNALRPRVFASDAATVIEVVHCYALFGCLDAYAYNQTSDQKPR